MIRIDKECSMDIHLTSILQKGVWMDFLPGETVEEFILRNLSLQKEEMLREIQTLILNNGCVDDPESAVLVSGDTLVLSGAMPGLVGAMLRSNSPIKAMRNSLSGAPRQAVDQSKVSKILLKLFNSVLMDHKDDILAQGFYMEDEGGST